MMSIERFNILLRYVFSCFQKRNIFRGYACMSAWDQGNCSREKVGVLPSQRAPIRSSRPIIAAHVHAGNKAPAQEAANWNWGCKCDNPESSSSLHPVTSSSICGRRSATNLCFLYEGELLVFPRCLSPTIRRDSHGCFFIMDARVFSKYDNISARWLCDVAIENIFA